MSQSPQVTIIKIANVSQDLHQAISTANSRPGGVSGPNVSRALFWLHSIRVASKGIIETLNHCTISGSTPDEQLQGWISTNGHVVCQLALDEAKKAIRTNYPPRAFFGLVWPRTDLIPDHKIYEATEILRKHREYFDYLLASGISNRNVSEPSTASSVTLQTSESLSLFSRQHTLYEERAQTPSIGSQVIGDTTDTCGSFFYSHQLADQPGENTCDTSDNIRSKADLAGRESRDDIKDQVELEKLDVILQWIDAFRCFEKHRATLLQRQPGTCTWLPETDEYKAWFGGQTSTFLLLRGKAGSGKSVLVAHVIEQLEKSTTNEPCAFFYCDFGTERATDATEVIRSLLYQLLDQFRPGKTKPSALRVVGELVEERRKGKTLLRDITYLSSWVCRVAEQFIRPPFIIIDALDECKDVDCLLRAILDLKTVGLRLFVSSRPIQVIKHRLRGLPAVSVDKMEEEVSADIELHVSREIDSHPRLGSLDLVLKKKVHSTLCEKADGMFRWVQCQLDTLKACVTLQNFQEALDNLPIGLDATYERILLDIDQRPAEGKVARGALMWLVTTSRPLVLVEIVEALSIDLQNWKLDRGIAPVHKYVLLDALGSLVVYDEETDIVNLSHFSVKEYLMDALTRTKLPEYHINLREAHMQVFQLCMCYLILSLDKSFENETFDLTEGEILSLLPSRPLLDYIFSCAFDHLAHLEPTNDDTLDSMAALRLKIRNHPSQWAHMCKLASLYHPYQSWITPDHDFIICVLISAFPEPFLQAFLNRVPAKPKFDSNPLLHAVRFDKVGHARTLLLHGVDVNSSGWDVDGLQRDFRLPLEAALQRESDVWVDLFLKEGSAAIPRTIYSSIFCGFPRDYPPHFVAMLLQADEFVEWSKRAADDQDPELLLPLSQDRYGHHPVAELDLLAIVRRMVQIGHYLSPLDSSGRLLLAVASAVSKGHLSLLEYLFYVDAPMPSGVWEVFPELTLKLTHQNLDINVVAAKGDKVLHHVLGGHCMGDLRCWVLDCGRCSRQRTVLLATMGSKVERTLLTIIILSRKLRATFKDIHSQRAGDSANPDVLLQKIVVASGTLLLAINDSFPDNSTLDYRSRCWLLGQEPDACLEILHQMLNLAGLDPPGETVIKLDGGDYCDKQLSLPSEDKINETISFFNTQWGCIQSLLSAANYDMTETLPTGSAASSDICDLEITAVSPSEPESEQSRDYRIAYIRTSPLSESSHDVYDTAYPEGSPLSGSSHYVYEMAYPERPPLSESSLYAYGLEPEVQSGLVTGSSHDVHDLEFEPQSGLDIVSTLSLNKETLERIRNPDTHKLPRGFIVNDFWPRLCLEISVFFTGQKGVGKSSLINMVRGIPDHSEASAKVSRDGRPCTAHTTSYRAFFQAGLRCQLWDTPGLDDPAARGHCHSMARLMDRFRELASQQTGQTEPFILWIVDTSKTVQDAQLNWQQFCELYVECSKDDAIPVIVLTRMHSDETGGALWYLNQIQEFNLRVGPMDAYVPLLRVRKHRGISSAECIEDAKAFRNLLSELALGINRGASAHHLTERWKDQAGIIARQLADEGTMTTPLWGEELVQPRGKIGL